MLSRLHYYITPNTIHTILHMWVALNTLLCLILRSFLHKTETAEKIKVMKLSDIWIS